MIQLLTAIEGRYNHHLCNVDRFGDYLAVNSLWFWLIEQGHVTGLNSDLGDFHLALSFVEIKNSHVAAEGYCSVEVLRQMRELGFTL
tara:strand:- start:446 stop:706 length:261 start_codon:yes stop_codon:yes gene_type:complete